MIAHATPEPLVSIEPTIPDWQAAIERLTASEESVKASYEAATVDPLNPIAKGIFPLGASADTHYPSEMALFLPVERARNAVRNHGLVEQGINRLLANLQLDEITLDIDSGDDVIDDDLKAWHQEWADCKSECDYEGVRTLGEIANQSMFSQLQDGDILHLPLEDGRIQTFEFHHVRSPASKIRANVSASGIIHGVEVKDGRVDGYYVTPQDVSLFNAGWGYRTQRIAAWNEFNEPNALHLGFRHRFAQRRGISRLNPPRNSMNGFDQLNWAHIHSAVRRSLIAFIEKDAGTTQPNPLAPGGGPQSGARYTETDGVEKKVIEFCGTPAQMFRMANGKTLEGWNADMPGGQFFEHAALLLSILAVNLDLPLSFFLLDGSLANFHGGRMVTEQARMRFRHLQRMQISGFYEPIYRWRVRQRITPGTPQYDPILANAVKRRGINPFAATFRAKGWPYVKPNEDVMARDTAERRNLKSHRQILAEDGMDFDDVKEEIVRDRGAMCRRSIKEAIAIRNEFPEAEINVGQLFREIWYGPNPSGTQLAIAGGAPEPNDPAENDVPANEKRGAA